MGSLIAPSSFYHPKCAEFNGTDEHMQRSGSPAFASDSAGAWSMWFNLDVLFGAEGASFGVMLASTITRNRMGIGIRRHNTTGTDTYFSVVGVNNLGTVTLRQSATTTALVAGQWYHVVWQSDGSLQSCYVNGISQTISAWGGVQANNGNWFATYPSASQLLTVGASYDFSTGIGGRFDGRLDQFTYIGGRALTAGEVTEIYNSGTPTNPHKWSFASDVDLWLPLGDSRDSATTAFDEIGSNDMTLVNMDASNYVNR